MQDFTSQVFLLLAVFLNFSSTVFSLYAPNENNISLNAKFQELTAGTLWVSDWMHGIELSNQKAYHEAIDCFSQAIEKIDKNSISRFAIYNDRAHAFREKEDFQKALDDYSYVIEHSFHFSSDLLIARYGRAAVYCLIDQKDFAFQDISFLMKFDPNLPRVEIIENYIVINNFDHALLDEYGLFAFKQSILDVHVCSSIDDVHFLPGKKCIINASYSYLDDVVMRDFEPDLLARAMVSVQFCSDKKNDKKTRETEIQECKAYCTAAARAGEVACFLLAAKPAQMACVALLEIALFRCTSCCEIGMGQCIDKFMHAMEPHIKNFINSGELQNYM